MVNKRRALRIIIFLFLIAVVGTAATLLSFLYYPIVHDKQGVVYTIHEGQSFQSVTADLQKQDVIKHPHFFALLIHFKGDANKLKAGEYLFPKGTTLSSLLEQIVTGSGLVHHPFTIIAGWNFKQVREALARENQLVHSTEKMSDHEVMAQLGYPNLNPEGLFFPDTYYFTSGYVDIKLLKRALKAMQDKLKTAWQTRAPGLRYTNVYQALIAASLIEKEAHFDIERPVVAGVILNRLQRNMLLQIDPTVIYGRGLRYDGTLSKKDLLIDTPYNTYLHKGLPPTPIAMPGMSSINAAMHPEDNDYIYYVARGDGYHQFSKTWEEHKKAVEAARKLRHEAFNSGLVKKYLIVILSEAKDLHPQVSYSLLGDPSLRSG